MRNVELESGIADLHMTKTAAAKALGLHLRTLQRYCQDVDLAPVWVVLAVNGLQARRAARIAEMAAKARASGGQPAASSEW